MSILLLLLAYFLPSLFIRKIAEERGNGQAAKRNRTNDGKPAGIPRRYRGGLRPRGTRFRHHRGWRSHRKRFESSLWKEAEDLFGRGRVSGSDDQERTDQGLYDEDVSDKKAQDMQRRCDRIKEAAPLLTVSIHQNSYPDPAVRGPQVFYYETSQEGQKLAASIQKELNDALTETNSREIKANDSYYLLKQSQGPAVIVECGFLSSPQDEALLVREEYQDRAAEAICRGIVEYLSGKAETIRESG